MRAGPSIARHLTAISTGGAGALVKLVTSADLPTRHGHFRLLMFVDEEADDEYPTLVRGDVQGTGDVLVRVHSQCFTGDVLGSLRCDCREQLEEAQRIIGASDRGVLIYMPQEGRGIGLINKIRAYGLQEKGLDTVEANLALGFDNDLRQYDPAATILRLLGVQSIRLLTNNPEKVESLQACGITVSERIPLLTPANPHNRRYLDTKRIKCSHML